MQTVSLIKANIQQLELIKELATSIWHEHYPNIITLDQINYMLDKMYDLESLNEQMNKLNHVFYLISFQDKFVGFISTEIKEDDCLHIHKFYIQTQKAGKGIGTSTLEELKNITKAKKFSLTVNRKNYKSINFYFKNNFTITDVKDFDIGNGYLMEDFIMTAELN